MATVKLDYFHGDEVRMCGFYRVPKAFERDERYKNASLEVKYLYCLMLDRVSLSTRNGWMDGGRVFIYFTIEDVKQSINVGKNKAVRVMSEMEALGLIMRKKRGQGRPTRIFVRNFIEDAPPVTEAAPVQPTDADINADFPVYADAGSRRYDDADRSRYETDEMSAPVESGFDVPFYTRPAKAVDDGKRTTPDNIAETPAFDPIFDPAFDSDFDRVNDIDRVNDDAGFIRPDERFSAFDDTGFPSGKDGFSGMEFDFPADDDFFPADSHAGNDGADGDDDFAPADNPANNGVDGDYDDAWAYDFAGEPAAKSHNAVHDPASRFTDDAFMTDSPDPEAGLRDAFDRSFGDGRAFGGRGVSAQTSDFETSRSFKTGLQDFPFWDPNKNNNKNNNDFINIESIYPAREFDFDGDPRAERRPDTMDWRKRIRENIDYGLLSVEHPEDMDRIDGFVEIMAQTCGSRLPTVRINREDMSRDEVRERFDELDQFHILYVLECLEKNQTRIRNIRAYILSALFNAPTTIDAYYDAQVSRDMNRER